MILSAEDPGSWAAVSVEIFQRFKKCPRKISGYGQVLDPSVRLNANFWWTVPELLVSGFSCNSSSPSLKEETLFQPTRLTFVLNLSTRSMVTCTQLWVLSTGHGSAGASPEKAMKLFWGLEHVCCGDALGGLFSLEKTRLQGELEPFPVPKGTPRELQVDFRQGPGVAGQGESLPEGSYGILGRNSSLWEWWGPNTGHPATVGDGTRWALRSVPTSHSSDLVYYYLTEHRRQCASPV